jgi:hypothetical protein
MTAPAEFKISRPILVLTDYQNLLPYRTTVALSATEGALATTLASGTASAVRGASMSVTNLTQLLDTVVGTNQPNWATGRAPYFSVPLESIPSFKVAASGTLELGASLGALVNNVGGSIAVIVETDSSNVTKILVDGAQSKIKDSPRIRIELSDQLEVGSTRIDDAGRAWLDLQFLTLFSFVTEGASLIALALGSSASGQFYLRFKGLPISLNDSAVLSLYANVVLDSAPNFAPTLNLGSSATTRLYAAQAGRPFGFGTDFFYGTDYATGSNASLDLIDPIENLFTALSGSAAITSTEQWQKTVPKPVLVAKPGAGDIRLATGEIVAFPSLDAVSVSLDPESQGSVRADVMSAPFVRFAGQVYRTLGFDELAGLQFVATAEQAAQHPVVPLSFLARDAQGALSSEFVAQFDIQVANVSGTVKHAMSGDPVPGVKVNLSKPGDASGKRYLAESDLSGAWSVPNLDFDRFISAAQLTPNPTEVAHALTAADVLAALKFAVGRPIGTLQTAEPALSTPSLGDVRRFAADINQNGVVEVDDAHSILNLVAKPEGSEHTSWRFIPRLSEVSPATSSSTSAGVAQLDTAAVDAVEIDAAQPAVLHWMGVLLGDVDGSWQAL